MFLRWIYRINKLVKRFAKIGQAPNGPVVKWNFDMWKDQAQAGELQFHVRDKWRQSDDFMDQTIRLFDHFGFTREAYVNETVIDVGAGSRLRSKYFIGAHITAIEPLANQFISDIPWCDLKDANQLYALPAEHRIERCVETADLVVSINVLDHCYDFFAILENIAAYLKENGMAFLSFDKHDEADQMHPLQLDEQVCEKLIMHSGLVIQEFSRGAGSVLRTYGHGPYCLNYRLKKAPPFETTNELKASK